MAELTRRDLAAERRGRATKPVRHGRLKPRRGWPGVARFVGVAVAVVVISALSLGTIFVYNLGATVSNNSFALPQGGSVQNAVQVGDFDGGFNLLIVGADNDPSQGDAYGVRGGTLNDVNILLHVSADHTTATAVSFPRDLVIQHPQCTDSKTGKVYGAMSAQPLNVAFSRGGTSCVVQTLENFTGLTIQYAAQFSFRAVVKMTDAVGGVQVCVANDINDPKAGLSLKAGLDTIKGKTALGFLRTRHGVGDGSDLSRISVQQIYMSALARKIKSADTLSNPVKLYNLATAAANNVYLSSSLTSLDTMVAMAKTMRTIDLANLNFVQYPGTTGNKNYPGKVVPNLVAGNALIAAIKADKVVHAKSLGRASEPDAATSTSTPSQTPTAPATGKATSTPSPTPTPTDTATANPSTVDVDTTGQPADAQTCARGYLK